MTGLRDDIQIDVFRDAYGPAFASLNRAWLEGHDLYEPLDGEYLDHPRERILDKGGEIFCAVRDGQVVGTCAVLTVDADAMELAKLTVAAEARGHGLGRRLTERAIAHARARGARRLVLSSNSRLTTAIALYEAMGFRHVAPGSGVGYDNADTFMALEL